MNRPIIWNDSRSALFTSLLSRGAQGNTDHVSRFCPGVMTMAACRGLCTSGLLDKVLTEAYMWHCVLGKDLLSSVFGSCDFCILNF